MKGLNRNPWLQYVLGLAAAGITCVGCWTTPSPHTISRDYSFGDAPIDPPADYTRDSFEDNLTGGRVYKMYCGRCHNARPLGERPFAFNVVSATHMREQAYLTGKEYRTLIHFLRRWHDVGPPTPDVEPSPKRFFFPQPIPELRPEAEEIRSTEARTARNAGLAWPPQPERE